MSTQVSIRSVNQQIQAMELQIRKERARLKELARLQRKRETLELKLDQLRKRTA